MKRFYKKALAAALCLALTLSCMPLSALSETPQITQPAVSGTAENLSEEAVPITEITEKRTGDSKTFLMSDGTYMNAVYPEQVHYNDNGKYKEIDNSFVYSDNNGKGHYKNKANSVSVNLPESYNNGYIELSDKNGYINFKLVGAGNKKLKIKNNNINNSKNDPTVITTVNSSVTYKSLKKNVDVQYDMNGSILKETIVLHKKTKESFIFELKTSAENVLVNSDKSISFYNSDGAEIYRMDSPFMEDSNGIYSNEIEVTLIKEDNGYILIYKPDYEWLSDKSRSYPVKIDPTVRTEQDLNSVETTYYTQNNYDLSAYGTLYAGFEKGKKAGLILL